MHSSSNFNSNTEHNPYSLYAESAVYALTKSHLNIEPNYSRHSMHHHANMSEMESAIIRSAVPIDIHESDEITVFGQSGIWANKAESMNWKGKVPLADYEINNDLEPQIIHKRPQQAVEYIQELAIRYLRPSTPPPPGDIIIRQEKSMLIPPAPPFVIRQLPARPSTPEPLIIREAPPKSPERLGTKVITISGAQLPPPPRKVVIERLAPLPAKPQSIIIERWLPYAQTKRRVIYQNLDGTSAAARVQKPKNLIVQWDAPHVKIKEEFKYLGVIRANPIEYVARYGAHLKSAAELPDFVHDIKNPDNLELAADHAQKYELEGDLHALNLIDLDKEGLGVYREYLQKSGVLRGTPSLPPTPKEDPYAQASQFEPANTNLRSYSAATSFAASSFVGSTIESDKAPPDTYLTQTLDSSIEQIFRLVDRENKGRIDADEAKKTLLRLNSRLKRQYEQEDVNAFFSTLRINPDNTLDMEEFKKAFLNIAIA